MVAHEDKVTILGILGFRAVGDFIIALTACVYAKKKIRNSALLIYAQDDRPYKNDILKLCPHIDGNVMATGTGIPIAWFDVTQTNTNPAPKEFSEAGYPHANLVLTPAMIADLYDHSKMKYFRCLTIPEDLDGELHQRLLDAGASPDRSIVCLHARQDGYEFRNFPEPNRSVDPASYFQLADYIIDELGGQVVRLGDPSMAPAPARPHLIDLSRGNLQVIKNSLVGVPFAVVLLESFSSELARCSCTRPINEPFSGFL